MELAPYIQIFRRWLLLIALVALVAGSINFINGVNRPPSYEARVTISIGLSLLDQAIFCPPRIFTLAWTWLRRISS